MSDALWLVLAGFGAGVVGSVAGLASLVSYPALLAVGLSPLSANVSNTVALVFGGIGSVAGSARELEGQWVQVRRLGVIMVTGGACGGLLLLATPAGDFVKIVPWLIAAGSMAILIRRPDPLAPTAPGPPAKWVLRCGVFAIALYAGYFGAAAGVLLLALLLVMSTETLVRSNALKNLLTCLANAVAAVAFVAFGPVRWWAVLPLAAGFLVGGALGPAVVRNVPSDALRVAIALAGMGLAVHLGLDAYS